MNAFTTIMLRDLRVAFRRLSELTNPLLFFVIVVALFPLALSPTAEVLRTVGTGVLWVSALLSSLLTLDAHVASVCPFAAVTRAVQTSG